MGSNGILTQLQRGLESSCSWSRHTLWFLAHRRVLKEESGIAGSRAVAGYSVLLAKALLGVAPSSQSMKTQQKPHLVRNFLHHPKRESKQRYSFKSEKTLRQLLGELYVDKEYLEKLLLDKGFRLLVCNRELGAKDVWGGCLMPELEAEPVTEY